jgi:uncharacterized protein YhaN
MRIDRLDLSRYGKFTDLSIGLPKAQRDFHLLVGANEAGKSTLRAAILDLLFGIEMRSAYDFLHPKADLRLQAAISHGAAVLDFQRVKKTRSLLDIHGAVLAESALASFLGNADRHFFDHMFGLDHDRLVKGGNEILKASNDVGRILFQSAAGIGSLGSVRDALELEADRLWARRKSNDRAYYVAAEQLAAAETTLKQATVRTREWSDYQGKVDSARCEFDETTGTFRALEAERVRLERIRRVAPAVRSVAEQAQALTLLGPVALLPEAAAQALGVAETKIAAAASEQRLASKLAEETRLALGQFSLDEAALRHATAILALSTRAQQTSAHERDIGRREIEIQGHWQSVLDAVKQLGWAVSDEVGIESRLPPLPLRNVLADLIKRQGVIEQTLSAAGEAERAKQREIARSSAQLDALPEVKASPELRAALDVALGLGDTVAARKQEAGKVSKAQRELRLAESQLGEWRLDLDMLRAMILPAAEVVKQQRRDAERLAADRRALAVRQSDLAAEIGKLELEIVQFRSARQAVTRDDVLVARDSRDSAWAAIKSGATSLNAGAADYEKRVASADGLSDQRHGKAQEAAELQARIDLLARTRLQFDTTGRQLALADAEEKSASLDWAKQATDLGLPGLPLLAYEDWRVAHGRVIAAADSVEQAKGDSAERERSIAAASSRLRATLAALGESPAEDVALDVLIETTKARVDGMTASKARREELQRQRESGREMLSGLCEKRERAQRAHSEWQAAWNAALVKAGLASDTPLAAAEGALTLFAVIDEKLREIHSTRKARIEMMRKDLDDFAQEALSLVQAMAPELAGRGAAAVALELSSRLAKAQDEQKEAMRLGEACRRFEMQMAESQRRMETAEAGIAPLLSASGSSSREALREAIARSDTLRTLTASTEKARQAAESGGDGLSLAQLSAEIAGADLAQIAVRLGEIANELESARVRQAELAAALSTAQAALARIDGKDDAARAESARQDALARMADAVERFIKVHTAGRLLRWAIDRYRETRQGPMLERASEIFARLTRGSFGKLVVDFECDPPTLDGQRPDGRTVGLGGMSDGTRDQLFLALRLAALEMHIGQAHALPFIADDLFINYDDERSKAGIEALASLSETTQVIFLTHHEHLVPTVKAVLGEAANIVALG